MKIDEVCKSVLVSEDEIQEACRRMGKEISEDFKDETVVVIGLLNGCNPFFSDLIKRIDLLIEIDYLRASSYHGSTHATTELQIKKDIETNIEGRNVIIVDDIQDTGNTFVEVKKFLQARNPKTIKTCTLLIKENGIEKEDPDYYGMRIPNEFVVGYGLDYDEHYRNLPYVGAIRDDLIKK